MTTSAKEGVQNKGGGFFMHNFINYFGDFHSSLTPSRLHKITLDANNLYPAGRLATKISRKYHFKPCLVYLEPCPSREASPFSGSGQCCHRGEKGAFLAFFRGILALNSDS